MTDHQTLFSIPSENMPKFEAQIAKLSRKSMKLIGSEIKPFVFSHEEKLLSDGFKHRVYSVMLTAETPRLEGWTFVARLDHSNETGTIIRMVPNSGELPEHYRHSSSTTCDHCNQKRYRRDTFVVRNDETGEHKQVGSSCLKDFFGHDPMKIAKMAELLGYAYECGRGYEEFEQFVGGDLRWISVEDFCAHAAMAVRAFGWVSGKVTYENPNLTSTRQRAVETFYEHTAKPTDADYELAVSALNWASSLREKDQLSDYEHNITVIADATMMEARSVGLAASIVGVFYNNQQKANPVAKTVDVGNFSAVIELMQRGGSKLKFPKIKLQLDDGQKIVLSVAGARAAKPGTVTITDGRPYGENIWFGRVHPDGVWDRSRSVNPATMTSLTALLSALALDPAATAARYGKLTGQCCFCSLPLTDARSTEVGYGKICAGNYGLPWGEK